MRIPDETIEKICTSCAKYADGTCPHSQQTDEDAKWSCFRVRDYLLSIYDHAIPDESKLTAEEFLADDRLAHLAWKHIVRFRFDYISEEAFEDVVRYVWQKGRPLIVRLPISAKERESLERHAAIENKSLREYLDNYLRLGVATALREGEICESLREKSSPENQE